MKEKILAALKAKFGDVSESTLLRIAKDLAKTVIKEEDIDSAVEAITTQKVVEIVADSRATEAVNTALKNMRKKLRLGDDDKPLKTGDGDDDDEDKKKKKVIDDPEEPKWAKALREKMERETADLRTKLEGFEKGKKQEDLLGAIRKRLTEKGVDPKLLPILTKNLNIESEDSLDQLETDLLADFQTYAQGKAEEGIHIVIPADSSGKPSEIGEKAGEDIAKKRNTGESQGTNKKKL